MRALSLFLILLSFSKVSAAEPAKASLGGAHYRSCYYCHSLQAGVQLTGPSLANLWGKPAAQVAGYGLYTDALNNSKLKWDEETLRRWLQDPKHVVPQTSMTYAGLKDSKALDELILFLKIALKPDGYANVLKDKLVTEETAVGQLPKDLTKPLDAARVSGIKHCRDSFTLTMNDKRTVKHWDQNIDLKVVTGVRAPKPGEAVLVPTGSMGDRFKIVFGSLDSMKQMVQECDQPSGQK